MNKLMILLVLCLNVLAHCQGTVDQDRVDQLAKAIAKAEGFGPKRNLPTRYHNPGDLKTTRAFRWDGQKGIGKGGHVIFKSDAEGWTALKQQILKAASGRSKAYNPRMTFQQIGKKYAGNWRTWSKNVAKNLGVPPTTTLRAYLAPVEPVAPTVVPEGGTLVLVEVTPVLPSLGIVYPDFLTDYPSIIPSFATPTLDNSLYGG